MKNNDPIKPVITLCMIPNSSTAEHPNAYGYEFIHFWQFNVDGQGEALVTYDDSDEFHGISGDDLVSVLHGDPGSGHRWYRPVNLSTISS